MDQAIIYHGIIMKKTTRGIVIALGAIVVLIAAWWMIDIKTSVSRIELTNTIMDGLELRIRRHVAKYGGNHMTLNKIDEIPGIYNSTRDGWGNEIKWIHNECIYELISYGKDGTIGGSGENDDISKKFNVCK